MPPIRLDQVPFLNSTQPEIEVGDVLPTLAPTPTLSNDSEGRSSMWVSWGKEHRAMDVFFPMDSLRIDLIEGSNEVDSSHADRLISLLLSHIRVLTRQWWIGRSIAQMHGFLRGEFEITARGRPLNVPWSTTKGVPIGGHVKAVDNEIWNAAIERCVATKEPDTVQALLLDAEFFLFCGEVSSAALFAATAVEICKNEVLRCLWRRRHPGEEYKPPSDFDLAKHLDRELMKVGRVSLKREDRGLYDDMRDLWELRKCVAHGAPAFYYRNQRRHDLNHDVALRLIEAARRCVVWLRL